MPAVHGAVRVRAVPPRSLRLGQQVLYKLRRLQFERAVVDPLRTARRAIGETAPVAAPRVLIRIDEFPHYQVWDRSDRFGTEQFERFHGIMANAGVPYLLAVPSRVSRAPLSPTGIESRPLDGGESAMLGRLADERVTFALHGRDHRTRFASPRRHSELCGLDRGQTDALIDEALAELATHGIQPSVFVAPFNRFDARQLAWLACRFAVVCGGPESIGQLGFQRSPQWRGETVYLPSYASLYGRAAEVLEALPQTIERAGGLWLPVTLHWGWEAEAGWRDLERLVARIAPFVVPWDDFLAAVARSRGADGASEFEAWPGR